MNVLVLGGAGMLGHKLVQTFHARGHTVETTLRGTLADLPEPVQTIFQGVKVSEGIDVGDFEKLRYFLDLRHPDVLLNAVGVIKQRDEAKVRRLAIQINALLPHELADWAAGRSSRLIHFSTDCVFKGDRGRYAETDEPDAVDLYGQTKALGEIHEAPALTLRTSIIGRELVRTHSLIEWFLRQTKVNGFSNAVYSGMTTQTLADLVAEIVESQPDLAGLCQAASEPISKRDLLHLVKNAFGLDTEILDDPTFKIDRSMRCNVLKESMGWTAPSWKEQIDRMAADPTPYQTHERTPTSAV